MCESPTSTEPDCGGDPYNPDTNMCENPTSTEPDCGEDPYNPDTDMCESPTFQPLTAEKAAEENTTYNSETDNCEDNPVSSVLM